MGSNLEDLPLLEDPPGHEETVRLPSNPTLGDYLRFGLAQNAGLRAERERWQASLYRETQATALPDPRLGWTHMVEEVQTRTGPQRHQFSLDQSIPWPGKLQAKGEVARREASWRRWSLEAMKNGVARQIKDIYYEYAYLSKAIGITADSLELLRQLEPIVQRRIQGGAGQEDLLRLQVEIGKLENELATLKNFRPALSARFSAILNRQATSLLPWPGEMDPTTFSFGSAMLMDRILRRNPDLIQMRERIAREEGKIQVAEVEGYPDFQLGLRYLETGSAISPGVPGTSDDPWGVALGLTLPIWQNKYSARREEARRARAAAQGDLDEKTNQLMADLRLKLYQQDDSRRQIKLYQDTLIPRSRQALEVTQSEYRTGKSNLLDVIDSERTLLAMEKSYWRAVANQQQRIADIEALCGGTIQ